MANESATAATRSLRGYGRRMRDNIKTAPTKKLDLDKAVATLRTFKAPKFDQTVELCLHLNINPKHADQAMRGSISLPHGVGASKRVIAFCNATVAKEALAAGAIKAGDEDLVKEIESGFMDFDVAIASPDMMRVVSKLGRVLGPKGLMPSPKAGTVTKDVVNAVGEFAAGKLEYRNDKGGNVHAVVGKMSFKDGDLIDNINHFIETIAKGKPNSVKGRFFKRITIKGTMTPGVYISHSAVEE